MDIRIDEIQRITHPGDSPGYLRVYIRVTATEGDKSEVMGFHIGRQVVGRAIVTNADGWYKLANRNRYIDPTTLDGTENYVWEYKTVTQDLLAEVKSVVLSTAKRRLALPRQNSRTTLRERLVFGDKATLPLAVRLLEGTVIT